MSNTKTIGILGSGTWGVALARLLQRNGHQVTVWSKFQAEVDALNSSRVHPNLPGLTISGDIAFTSDMRSVCQDKDILLFAVPSVFVRSTAAVAAEFIPDGQIIVDVAKGIEPDTLLTMTEVIQDELNKDGRHGNVKLVALSGPTHAEEVALDMPTSIVSACTDMDVAETVQDTFMDTCMRTYTNADVLGVELCGALKNIVALAAGISAGMGYGDNAKAALITRGMASQAMGKNWKLWKAAFGVALAATAKFLTLYLAVVKVLIPLMGDALKAPQVQKFTAMFSLPQLITALIGGALALALSPVIRKAIQK